MNTRQTLCSNPLSSLSRECKHTVNITRLCAKSRKDRNITQSSRGYYPAALLAHQPVFICDTPRLGAVRRRKKALFRRTTSRYCQVGLAERIPS
ncbi:hypothetical protein BaRGS_00000831 [Batillaria attramentaria]|uniref:Uncharacterized protein n=1 Tax=Batillaria attramentaria TaxID=370345 RepID=A0ABD0M8V1_9CAEN